MDATRTYRGDKSNEAKKEIDELQKAVTDMEKQVAEDKKLAKDSDDQLEAPQSNPVPLSPCSKAMRASGFEHSLKLHTTGHCATTSTYGDRQPLRSQNGPYTCRSYLEHVHAQSHRSDAHGNCHCHTRAGSRSRNVGTG